MGILSLLRSNWFWIALIAVLYSAAVVIHGSASYDRGYATGRAEGDAALLNLQLQHTNERAQSLQDSLVQYKQQVARAAQAEEQLLQVQQQLTDTRHQLQERIAHVSTAYRAAPGAAPTAIP
ncbi:TPA: lysis protein, partial [Pseudomonas aeruginosa]|nr:lysis protein [Pseudomonas aeruginosa]